jgi:hypothetical protein
MVSMIDTTMDVAAQGRLSEFINQIGNVLNNKVTSQ